MQSKLATIVIPIYKVNLSESEQMSLNQCFKVLGDFDIVFAHPENLDVSSINKDGKARTEAFQDHYFKTVFGYNSLMLSEVFYERFLDFKYLLIYQLDAFVFKNELIEWCEKGYDYIGAPWIASPNTIVKKVLSLFDSKRKKERSKIFFKVGNGGFSLRNVSKSYEIAKALKPEIEANLKREQNDFYIMEDVFWSITVPKHYPDFSIPFYKEALGFAMDRKPGLALKLNNNKLPFGCHGFDKPKVEAFWKDILASNYVG
ncbi:DUF5672 family protein [Lacinutrix sp. Bg11-31]|uniref:DUF5672 family protein n=1 Tax=Lacinutrix sp. Bg11-31 TaxID=2057808 RepID=UPI000C31436E|nr:DUF5672 family protein [Lacinutrix sp. Bg11-31]AUC80646.1 hypothetical protein CW733_00240 [Lacinutrix sp. Bg11-31]